MSRRSILVGRLALGLAALLLSGCTGGPDQGASRPPSASAPVPSASQTAAGIQVEPGDPGWIVYRDPVNAFELQAPEWMRDVTDAAASQNPLIRVAVLNPLVQTTSIQVIVAPLDPGTTLPEFASDTATRLAQIPGFAGIHGRETTTLGGQPAERIDWSASVGGHTFVEREYLVVRDGRGYVVAIDTTPKLRGPDFDTFSKITPRFRFVP